MEDSLRKNVLRANALPDLLSDLNIKHEDDSEVELDAEQTDEPKPLTKLPFPPLTKQHILNCSYHTWHPKYRTITPKARLIPLTPPFLEYLHADGIILPDDDEQHTPWSDDEGVFSQTDDTDTTDDDQDQDPAAQWREIHNGIKSTIAELGGNVVPKLNWSAPKDAIWISATNSMECRSPSDVYLLLKSSDFVTHDLGHAFDDCVEDGSTPEIDFHLVLRKYVQLNPSLEFRCFVRDRKVIAICQRDLNHFDFLFKMQDKFRDRIQDFFDQKLKDTFPDENFAFDVYLPPPHDRVWLIDVNPWAMRTDPLLFSWLELLTIPGPSTTKLPDNLEDVMSEFGVAEDIWVPEFRLIRADDPEAYGFTSQQYSAHKLPRDVVDASQGGEGQLREFAQQWKELLEKQKQQQDEVEESEAD